jgi:hypothetical protein
MAIKANDQQALDDLYAQYKPTYGGARQDYFSLIYLRKRFGLNVEDLTYRVAFNGNDYGLDAYYIDHEAHNLYLYQFKWTENHALFKDSIVRLTDFGIERIFHSPNQDILQNELLGYLKKELNEARDRIYRVYIHFVFKGDIDACEKNEGLANRREDLESKSHIINGYFGREIELQVDFISDKPGKKGPPPSQSHEITLSKHIETKHGGVVMYVGFIPLCELHRIYVALREQLFDRNIRGALPSDNAPNRKIREALEGIVLKGIDDTSVFPFRHNGVTIAAEKVTAVDGRMRLYVPRVLNGAQTISSTDRFLAQHAGNPLLKQNRDKFEAISVIAKIIADDPASDFVTQVTISNNQQNPVPAWALRAMDRRQVDLADKFREELGIFYSRQEGVFENLSDEDKEQLGIEEDKAIRIRPLAQTFLAVQGDVYNMGHLPDVFESQQLYTKTFKTSYDNVDGRSIVLTYKVGLMIRRAIERLNETVPAKFYDAIPKSRNLVWALLIQAMLNDKKHQTFRDLYGDSLKREFAYGDVLKQLTGTRVWPLLKDLLNSPHYRDRVERNKYEFLRTADAFKKAMNLAQDKFGWQKKSLS